MQTTTEEAQGAATAGEAAPALAPALAPAKTIKTTGADGKEITVTVPRTIEEMQQLMAQRDQLSEQLVSVTNRRQNLVAELRSSPDGAARTGLEDRLKVLDARILQLERDLASTGQQIAAAPSDLVQVTQVANNAGGGDDFGEGLAAGIFPTAAFFLLILAFRRWRRKRRGPKPAVTLNDANAQRLERLEQGMEAIAIEIERVSEGQRFVTKLLSEAPALNGRQLVGAEKQTANP